jgi:DNA-binding transcriptional regulator YiaG
MQNRRAYIEKMKQELDVLNSKLNELEQSSVDMQEDARARYNVEVEKVRVQSELAKEKFARLIDSSEGAWNDMVAETEKIRDAFVNSFHYFKSQI